MKNLVFLLLIMVSQNYLSGQTIFEPSSKISSATIYERGAMVTRTIDTKDIKSNGVITIDSLPQQINLKSIQARCGSGLKIVSIKNTHDQIRIEDFDKIDSINALLEIAQDSIDYQLTLLKSIKKEIDVIHKNDNFNTEDGTNMEQLTKASELYKTRLRALDLEYLAITKKRDRFYNAQYKMKTELSSLSVKTFNNIGVEVKVEYVSEMDKTMTLSYFTPQASWYTFYDLRIANAESKSFLDHKAYVSQHTGEDWNDVKLTLSNRNPNKRIAPPTISPYILQNVRHHGYSQNTYQIDNAEYDSDRIYGKVTDKSGDALIGANILYKSSSIGTITDIDGRFSLPRTGSNILVVSYTGYETQEVPVAGLSYCGIVLAKGRMLDEIVVTGLGIEKETKALGYAVDDFGSKRMKKKEVRKSISVKPQQSLNVHSFEITSPYSIPSNGEEYDVLLNTNTIPFAYQYEAYPSQEPTAYLSVGIPNWRSYDLFSGKVNLFLEGQYTGVSKLDISAKTDTLWFSLGEDIGVHIEKEMMEEYNKKSFFKNKTIELHTFDIIVKNNKNKAVDIDIFDQVPISTDDDIKVKILEISEAEYKEKQGFLTWHETLSPGGSKTFRVSYEIKYGKNVDIVSN